MATLLGLVEKQYEADRSLRKQYAKWFLAIFIGEAGVAAFALVAIGVGWLHISQWVASTFFVTVFFQIAAVVQTVARGLRLPNNATHAWLQ